MKLNARLTNFHSSLFFIIIIICIVITIPVKSQNLLNDQQLMLEQDFKLERFDQRKVTFITSKSNKPLVKYNPVSLTLGALLYCYQKVISPQLSTNCPYKISCSSFSKQCIHEFGIIKGIALSADRLTRCTKLSLKDIHSFEIDRKARKINDSAEKYYYNR